MINSNKIVAKEVSGKLRPLNKRAQTFVRFGKRAQTFVRFGRNQCMLFFYRIFLDFLLINSRKETAIHFSSIFAAFP